MYFPREHRGGARKEATKSLTVNFIPLPPVGLDHDSDLISGWLSSLDGLRKAQQYPSTGPVCPSVL